LRGGPPLFYVGMLIKTPPRAFRTTPRRTQRSKNHHQDTCQIVSTKSASESRFHTTSVAIGFVGAISFLLSVAIARRFGPEAFGVYAQAVSLGAFLVILIDGGFGKLLIHETVRESSALIGQGKDLHGFAFGHAFLVMAILALLVVLNPLHMHWPTLLAAVGAFGGITCCSSSPMSPRRMSALTG